MQNLGLTSKEVEEKIKLGEVNKSKKTSSKSHLKIIFDSIFSLFNIILFVVAILYLIFQLNFENGFSQIPVTKYGFLFVITFNALISIITEEKSKKVLNKIELLKKRKVIVLRDNKEIEIDSSFLVIGDIFKLFPGEEVIVDSLLISKEALINEAVITGESDFLFKKEGEEILSGSINEGSEVLLKVIRVGDNSFIKKLEKEVKSIKKEESILKKELNQVIYIILCFMVPSFLAVFLKTYYIGVDGKHRVLSLNIVTKSSTVVVGMLSIGLFLLASITLAQAVINLSKKNIMVKELYAIENLARIDTICFDKTGTLTESNILVDNIVYLKNENETKEELGIYLNAFKNDNATSLAIKNYLNNKKKEEYSDILIFNSKNKFSSCSFLNSNYKLGAPDILLSDEKILEEIKRENEKGKRSVVFIKNNDLVAIIYLKNSLRKNIKETIQYFKNINVNMKVISGDNLETVKKIALLAGFNENIKEISLEGKSDKEIIDIAEDYDIFARSTPHQKELIISTLKEKGHKVGYVGDGVNDLSSLKRANCSIALNGGVSSVKNISDFVLLNDDFGALPEIINEGRRTVNNIKRTCLLFLSKAFFIFFFALFSLFSKEGFVIEIESLYIYERISVALCGFLLSIENNTYQSIEPNFVKEVIKKSLFLALFLSVPCLILSVLANFVEITHLESMISIIVALNGATILFMISYPYSKYSFGVSLFGLFASMFLMILLPDVLLTSTYIKQGENVSEQIHLIIDDLFNFDLFKSFSLLEVFILLFLLLGSVTLFVILYFKVFVNRKSASKK